METKGIGSSDATESTSGRNGGSELDSHPQLMESRPRSVCCECKKVGAMHWSTLADPIMRMKLELQTLEAHLAARPEKDVSEGLSACLRAATALETAYGCMVERQRDLVEPNWTGGADLAAFMRQNVQWLKVKARRSGCSIISRNLACLPRVNIEHKCLWCFFSCFFDAVLEVGANGESWKLELIGRVQGSTVHIRSSAHHPKRKEIMELAWAKMDLGNGPPDCAMAPRAEFQGDAGQESVVLTLPVQVNHRVWKGTENSD